MIQPWSLYTCTLGLWCPLPLCPVGGSAHMAQYFRGNLAGLMIRSGKLDNKKVIDCLYTCKEGLDVQLPEEVANSVKVRAGGQSSDLSNSLTGNLFCLCFSTLYYLYIFAVPWCRWRCCH